MSEIKRRHANNINVEVSHVGAPTSDERLAQTHRALAVRYLQQLRIGLEDDAPFAVHCDCLEGIHGSAVPMAITSPRAGVVEVAMPADNTAAERLFALDDSTPTQPRDLETYTIIKNALFDALVRRDEM